MDVDQILDLLSEEPRRDVIEFCRWEGNRQTQFDELVDYVVEKRRRRGGNDDGDRVRAKLHHVHLPRLAEGGVLEYDSRSGDVRYWGHDRVEACLDAVRSV